MTNGLQGQISDPLGQSTDSQAVILEVKPVVFIRCTIGWSTNSDIGQGQTAGLTSWMLQNSTSIQNLPMDCKNKPL